MRPYSAWPARALAGVLALLGSLSAPNFGAAQAPTARVPANKETFELYLLLGQSNMQGRGYLEAQDQQPHPRVLMLTQSKGWRPAVEPLHELNGRACVGPGLAFGKAMAESRPDLTIGLVPCAVGGTYLKRWQRGGDLYSNAVARARLAMRVGTLKGILWHQGEQDSMDATNAATYFDRLRTTIADLRAGLGQPDLPFVVGQIGEFLYHRKVQQTPYAEVVNEALARIPQDVPHSACISSAGLQHNPGDEVHFNNISQRELGRRFARAMLALQGH